MVGGGSRAFGTRAHLDLKGFQRDDAMTVAWEAMVRSARHIVVKGDAAIELSSGVSEVIAVFSCHRPVLFRSFIFLAITKKSIWNSRQCPFVAVLFPSPLPRETAASARPK